MKITIFGGTGSLGVYFTYRFIKAGHDVSIIGRENSQNLNQIANYGLTIKFSNETVFVPSTSFVYIGSYNSSLQLQKQDLVIISLKQPDFNFSVAQQIFNITDSNSIIGIISNGLPFYFLSEFSLINENHIEAIDPKGKILKLLLPARQIVSIVPLMGSNVESPGVIKVINPSDKIKTFVGGRNINNEKLDLLSKTLNSSLIPNTISDNICKILLEKLQFSLAINVMSALLDRHNGVVFQDEANQVYVRYVISFVSFLAKALNIDNVRNYEAFKALNISEARYSSMHEDIAKGKTPEIKVIVSTPLELAQSLSIEISTKPIKLLEELLIGLSRKVSVTSQQIEELYYEAQLALEAIGVNKTITYSEFDTDL